MGNTNDLRLHVWTATGYNVALTHNGKPLQMAIYFSGKNCTGDAYIDGWVGLAGKAHLQARLLAYSSVQNSWFAALSKDPAKNTITEQYSSSGKPSAENPDGLCDNSPTGATSTFGLFKATKVTHAEAGLPASIAPGLYVKPL